MISTTFLRSLTLLVVAIAVWGCSANGPPFIRHTDPSSEEALIYLYRPSRWTARLWGPEILINGQNWIRLLNKGYSLAYVAPERLISWPNGTNPVV